MKRMLTKSWFRTAAAILLTSFAALARADVPGSLELAIGTGYTRGIGGARGPIPALQHLAGNGGALRVEVGWRIDPRWLVGTYYEGSSFAAGHQGTDGMWAGAAGLQGQFHVSPFSTLDPWIGVGFGWRGLWLDHGMGTHAMQGLDLVRLHLGVDYRVSPRLSLAPTIGVAMTELLSEKAPGARGYTDIGDRKVSAFVFAGVSGRIEVRSGAGAR